MKALISFIIIAAVMLPAGRVFAQEKKAQRHVVKVQTTQPQMSETLQIVYKLARGAKLESIDAKNVFFILRPTGAFIQINF